MLLHMHEKVALLFAAFMLFTLFVPPAAHAFIPGPAPPIQIPETPSSPQQPSGWPFGDPAQNPFFWSLLFPQGLSPEPAPLTPGASPGGPLIIEIPPGSSPSTGMPPGWPFIEPGQATPIPPLVIPEPGSEFPLLFPQTQGGGSTIFIDPTQSAPPSPPAGWPFTTQPAPPSLPTGWPFTTQGGGPTGPTPTVIPGQGSSTVVLPGGETFLLPNEFIDPALRESLGIK